MPLDALFLSLSRAHRTNIAHKYPVRRVDVLLLAG
jgi:hypothetical protein